MKLWDEGKLILHQSFLFLAVNSSDKPPCVKKKTEEALYICIDSSIFINSESLILCLVG